LVWVLIEGSVIEYEPRPMLRKKREERKGGRGEVEAQVRTGETMNFFIKR
jgi:hypothetical protein